MKKLNLLLAGLLLLCSTTVSSAKQNSVSYFFVSSCGVVLSFEIFGPHEPSQIYNTAIDMDAAQCGPGGPVPKVWMLAP